MSWLSSLILCKAWSDKKMDKLHFKQKLKSEVSASSNYKSLNLQYFAQILFWDIFPTDLRSLCACSFSSRCQRAQRRLRRWAAPPGSDWLVTTEGHRSQQVQSGTLECHGRTDAHGGQIITAVNRNGIWAGSAAQFNVRVVISCRWVKCCVMQSEPKGAAERFICIHVGEFIGGGANGALPVIRHTQLCK